MSEIDEVRRTLRACIGARDSGIWITTVEERRIEQEAIALGKKLDIGVMLWSCGVGFTSPSGNGEAGLGSVQEPEEALTSAMGWNSPCIFVLRDFAPYVDLALPPNVRIVRMMRDVLRACKSLPDDKRKIFIFTSCSVDLPEDLREEIVLLTWPLPDRGEIASMVSAAMKERPDVAEKMKADGVESEPIVEAARGLTLAETENVLSRSMALKGTLDVEIIAAGKKQAVQRDGGIEWLEKNCTLNDIGGQEVLKQWAVDRKTTFSEEARAFGIRPPRGCLLTGPSGTGKSLAAKSLATAWDMVLVKMDIAALKGSYVGESEANIIKALKTIVAVAPCVVLVDEIEKAISGSSGAGAGLDSGVGSNMLGLLLNFMQENTAPVFFAASSNDASILPPELTRKGRMDVIWLVDLPHAGERMAIWDVHLRKVGRAVENYGVIRLADETEGFTGAEIEGCIQDALVSAFSAGEELMPKHLLAAIASTVPTAVTFKDKVDSIRAWAKGRARSASALPEAKESDSVGRFGRVNDSSN